LIKVDTLGTDQKSNAPIIITENDILAMDLLLNTNGLDLNIMTATASEKLVYYKDDVDAHLKGKGGIWDHLVRRWEDYVKVKTWSSPWATEKRWIMWDIAIMEALANPKTAVKIETKPPQENTQRDIHVYTKIDANAMKTAYWSAVQRAMAVEKQSQNR
jgi:hypothetical protein